MFKKKYVIRVKQKRQSIMKKLQYIQPQTIVVRMQTIQMIAGSNELPGSGDQADLNPETMDTGNGGDAASRRHRNDWDDEEDDW